LVLPLPVTADLGLEDDFGCYLGGGGKNQWRKVAFA
jgi:hypothetical protein